MIAKTDFAQVAILAILAGFLAIMPFSYASAQGMLASCGKDLQTYCSKVTPGEGRIMACLYAHGDKISDTCVNEVEDAALKLQAAIDAIQWGYEQCSIDIEKFCAKTEPGQQRMYRCIKANSASLSKECKAAVTRLEMRFGGATKQ